MEFLIPDYSFLILSALLFLAVLASKTSGKLGVPVLVFFMFIGWLFGPTLLGFFEVTDAPWLANASTIALSLILFSGGLDTSFSEVKPVIWRGISLATIGVLLTALVTAVVAYWLLPMTFPQAFLLGSIVSSTDAAAVFSVLRSRSIGLKHRLRPLLEFESGSNDPMALLLTTAALSWVIGEQTNPGLLVLDAVMQLVFGAGLGILIGWVTVKLVNRIKLQYEGLFSVLILSVVFLTFALAEILNANTLLAMYCAGMVLGHSAFVHKQSAMKFFDGLAWIMQIFIFVSLGLLLIPSQIQEFVKPGLILSAILIFFSRTVAVLLTLLPFRRISLNERIFISWVGLKGAAPLVLGLYPLMMVSQGMEESVAIAILNIVYFMVVLSVLIQGTTLTAVAKWLNLDIPLGEKVFYPLELEERSNFRSLMQEVVIPSDSEVSGKTLVELNLPTNSLILLISRGDQFIMPNGGTALESNDKLLVLATTLTDLEGVYHQLGMDIPEST